MRKIINSGRSMWRGLGLCLVATAALVVSTTTAKAVTVESFDDITLWAGTGSNRAGLIIDWGDGPALAWGYRWDGVATGQDMLTAIAAADSRLHLDGDWFDFGSGPVLFINALGYDRNGDGFSELDPADSFIEAAWPTSTLHYWNHESGATGLAPQQDSDWTLASLGVSDRVLQDGSWDGMSFGPAMPDEPWDLLGDPPSLTPQAAGGASTTNPVPEPATAGLVLIAGAALLATRRR